MDGTDARFIEYLDAKRSIDDRSLHPRVWTAFLDQIEGRRSRGLVEIAELGAGIGTMCQRVFRALGTGGMRYHLVDENPALLEAADRRIAADFFPNPPNSPEPRCPADSVLFHVNDALTWLTEDRSGVPFQAILANAFLDLVDIPAALDRIFERLTPRGLAYLTVNYDGRTDFLPSLDTDREVLGLYNESMRHWKGAYRGTDRSGTRILECLLDRGIPILDLGASDWVVAGRTAEGAAGGYSRDETIFLRAILDMVEGAVSRSALGPGILANWMDTRRRQAAQGKLVYVAHQLDILAQKPFG